MSSPLNLFPGRIADVEVAHEFALVLDAQRTQMLRINSLLDELSNANLRIAALIREKTAVEVKHEDFRQQVRNLAIEKREEMNFCVPGLNAALDELGLDPMTRTFRVPVTIIAEQEVYVEVEAADEDDAREQVSEDWELAWDVRDNDRYSWSHKDQEVASSYRIEEVEN